MQTAHIKVPAELFALAESSRFEGELDLETFTATGDAYAPVGPIAWWVDITNTGEALLVSGKARCTAQTDCARCLKPAEFDFEGDIEGYFLIDEDAAGPDDMAADEFDVLPASHVIDLEPLIVAGLIMDAPTVPLCSDDCAGLCNVCGADLNEGPCGCDTTAEDEAFEEAKNPFAVLKNLSFDD